MNRTPTIALTYERLRAIFRKARHLHSPTEFTTEAGDEEKNPYDDAERRLAEARDEARIETERRVAEARNEALNEARIEMERRMAAEIERRVAKGRLDAE